MRQIDRAFFARQRARRQAAADASEQSAYAPLRLRSDDAIEALIEADRLNAVEMAVDGWLRGTRVIAAALAEKEAA